ncbi:hypothetical protein [Pseudomonas sp. FP818]|uniref:hypothetical protein n=1 Tax=Pseudomonas sp. FP818 TaxID=2954099 RepID=UPI00273542ED|nr:hypothetical protein [Pseudomonas sp. FP818]WLI32913.1 hypothetical protein PSH80_16815 [Pseudomonas sp. FP818]WLI36328.1 hypothetical protein PSH80_08335 [Pseudomonas sp. FP818]
MTAAEELDAVLHWRGKHSIAVRERDGLQLSLNTADQTIDDLSAAVSRRTKRVRDLEAQLAYAVDALNEVVKASAMYERPFEIATLAIGEMSAVIEQPAPVAVNSQAMTELRWIFDSNKGADGTLVISKKLAAQILNPSL